MESGQRAFSHLADTAGRTASVDDPSFIHKDFPDWRAGSGLAIPQSSTQNVPKRAFLIGGILATMPTVLN
jgi:hypothetical protein